MKAILLAAGQGSRLRPFTSGIPKCLVPINGRPLLEYWLADLIKAGITEILVNLSYLADEVRQILQASPFNQFISLSYEKELLGTGGTLLAARKFWQDGPVMLIHADNLSTCDLPAFIQAHYHRPEGVEITMMTFETDVPEKCGVVDLDRNNIVHAFHEKVANPPSNLANAAVYIVEPGVLTFLEDLSKPVIDFSTEVIPDFMGKIIAWHNGQYHRDIGNIQSFMMAQQDYSFLQRDLPGQKIDYWQRYCGPEKVKEIVGKLIESLQGEPQLGACESHDNWIVSPDPLLYRAKTQGRIFVAENLSDKLLEQISQSPGSFRAAIFGYAPHGSSLPKKIFDQHGIAIFVICRKRE